MKILSFLTHLLCLTANEPINESKPDTLWYTEDKKVYKDSCKDPLIFSTLRAFVGPDPKKKVPAVDLVFDFGTDYTVIGDDKTQDWGLVCDDTCQTRSDTMFEDYFQYMVYEYKEADVYLRSISKQKLITETKPKMSFRLVEGGQKWPLGSSGVLGLSPSGSFAEYVRQMYDNGLSLIIGFESYKDDNGDRNYRNSVAQNPTIKKESLIAKYNIGNDKKHWTLVGDVDTSIASFNSNNTDICLTNQDDSIILIENGDVYCEQLLNQICKGKKFDECKEGDIDYDNAPELTVNVCDIKYTFNAKEYIFFNSEGIAQCRIGDIFNINSLGVCPLKTKAAIGMSFFEKYTPVLGFNKDGSSEISFVTDFEFPKNGGSWGTIISFAIVLGVVLIVVFILSLKKKAHDEKYFAVSDDNEV